MSLRTTSMLVPGLAIKCIRKSVSWNCGRYSVLKQEEQRHPARQEKDDAADHHRAVVQDRRQDPAIDAAQHANQRRFAGPIHRARQQQQ